MIEPELSGLRGKRVLCALSGGADSVCLLHMLMSAGLEVTAAHYEHGIRGEESLRDAEFVKKLCEDWGVRCVVGHGDVPGYAGAQGLGTEEAARLLRYEFLQQTLRELGYDVIATAHNADDNAETILFNLCRGTGAAGLRGIPERRDNIVRPLLGVTRREIEDYLLANGLPHVEDSSNREDEYSRNLIRHRVVPALREINPEFAAAAARSAKLLRQDEDCLSMQAAAFIEERFDGESLPCAALLSLHPAVASRVIRQLAGGSLSMKQVESVLAMCESRELGFADIPGRRLRAERGRLWLWPEEEAPELPCRELRPGETLDIPEAGLRLRAETAEYKGEINGLFKTYFLKYENICPVIRVTGPKPGDRLRLPGRGCTKTLKSLFAEKGYTQRQRRLCPVLRDGEGTAVVYGLGIAERLSPLPGDSVLVIKFDTIQERTEEDAQ